jgi:hypothetical protein
MLGVLFRCATDLSRPLVARNAAPNAIAVSQLVFSLSLTLSRSKPGDNPLITRS